MANDKEFCKKIKTDCPFPSLLYNPRVTYKEVTKPTGVAYILLELISNSSVVDDEISEVLVQFGIPEDLHSIFAKETKILMETGVIATDYYNTDTIERYFSEIRVNDLRLTEIGRKLFKDQFIPTGDEKVKSVPIYFDIVRRKTSYEIVSKLAYSTSFLSKEEEFADRVIRDVDTGRVEELIENKKEGLGLKKEEEVISVDVGDADWKVVKPEKNLTISVSANDVSFSLEDSDESAFFNKYFSSDTIMNVLSGKNKFKFGGESKYPEANIGELSFSDVFIPGDLQSLANAPCGVFIGRKSDAFARLQSSVQRAALEDESLLSVLGEDVLFAVLLENGDCRYYCAYNTRVPCPQFDSDLFMDLVFCFEASSEQKERFYAALKTKCFDSEVKKTYAGVIAYLDGNSGPVCRDYTYKKIYEVDSEDVRIGRLVELDGAFKKVPGWDGILREYGKKLYDEFIADSDADNVGFKIRTLRPLNKILNVSDKTCVSDLSRIFVTEDNAIVAFDAFVDAGLTTELILTSVNVIRTYCDFILRGEAIPGGAFGRKFDTVRNALWHLNNMLGIKSPTDIPGDEDFGTDDFLNGMVNLDRSLKNIEKYRGYAKDRYDEIYAYIEIFKPVRETLSIEKAAQSSPEKVTKEYIDGLISKGLFKNAVTELYIKLQYVLSGRLGEDMNIGGKNLIDHAFDRGLCDEDDTDALHKLRICRNDFQHPRDKMCVTPDERSLETWERIVFSL